MQVAVPPDSGTLPHSAVAPSSNATVPVAEAGWTAAVKVTDWPCWLDEPELFKDTVVAFLATVTFTVPVAAM